MITESLYVGLGLLRLTVGVRYCWGISQEGNFFVRMAAWLGSALCFWLGVWLVVLGLKGMI